MDRLHIMPVNDSIQHTPDTGCICNPYPESSTIYVHRSADGREEEENARGRAIEGKEWEIAYEL